MNSTLIPLSLTYVSFFLSLTPHYLLFVRVLLVSICCLIHRFFLMPFIYIYCFVFSFTFLLLLLRIHSFLPFSCSFFTLFTVSYVVLHFCTHSSRFVTPSFLSVFCLIELHLFVPLFPLLGSSFSFFVCVFFFHIFKMFLFFRSRLYLCLR